MCTVQCEASRYQMNDTSSDLQELPFWEGAKQQFQYNVVKVVRDAAHVERGQGSLHGVFPTERTASSRGRVCGGEE